MGWESRYFAALPPRLHDEMRMLVAGTWVPLALAMDHYAACDRMDLTTDEKEHMGKQVSLRTQKTFVGTLGSVVAGAGATPWNVLTYTPRIWARIFEGGDCCVYKLGPKDALTVATANPLLRLDYFRTAIRAYYAALANLVSTTVYHREVAEYRNETQTGFRLSWA
jgi:hypothetical protein